MTRSPDQFLDVARLLPDALLLVTVEGTILELNPPAAEVLARPPSRLRGRSLLEFALGAPESVLEYLGYCSRETNALPGGFTVNLGTEAARFWCWGARIPGDADLPTILLRIGRQDEDSHRFSLLRLKVEELTEETLRRRRAEEELRNLNALLEERVRSRTAELSRANRDLEQFAWSVAHDLRAPLRTISMLVSMFREDNEAGVGSPERDLLDRVELSCDRMREMIEGLLQLSSVTRGEFEREPVDLSALSRTVVTELQALTPGRRVDVRIEEGLSDWAHPALAAIVLQNLIGNAWKFTGKTASPRIDIGRTRSAEGDSFCVRDNGVGFDPAGVTDGFKLFQRFHSREEFEGSGIGLATVERIILRHGGRIRVESAPGKGAAFYFSFGPPRSFPTTDRTASGPDSLVR